MKVRAAVARAHGAPLTIEGLDLDEPRDDEVLVRLVACGVARADLRAIAGEIAMPLPFVPGTEGAGIVEKVGAAVTHVEAGDAVLMTAGACGVCPSCVAGRPRACRDFGALNLGGRRLDGSTPLLIDDRANDEAPGAPVEVNGFFFGQSSFATHALCRGSSLIKLAVGAPLELLAGCGGELLIGAGIVADGFRFEAQDTLVITGVDAVACVAIMFARARGAGTIFVADRREDRRTLAVELGATVVLDGAEDLPSAVMSMTGSGARFALDTTGDDAARRACLASLAEGGLFALLDQVGAATIDGGEQAASKAAKIITADGHGDPHVLIPELVALQAQGRLPLDKLISFFPFELVNDALAAFVEGRVIKPVLRFPLGPFGDLERAKTEGTVAEVPVEDEAPEPKKTPDDEERVPAIPA